jgi:hypothetical protein
VREMKEKVRVRMIIIAILQFDINISLADTGEKMLDIHGTGENPTKKSNKRYYKKSAV